MDESTPKQQVTELLRQAESVIIAVSQRPTIDQIAAAIGLTQMLGKLGKRPEAVCSGQPPKYLSFLPLNLLRSQFSGLRDFVIELDTSKIEADKLKYIPEDKRLKIYITPYNGSFTKEDVAFSYGEYHTDALIMLGAATPAEIDPALRDQRALLDKTKLISIMAERGTVANERVLAWHEDQASSISEMLMSLTEALQPGLLDNHIATSLLTGIVGATEHFTAANTTPKVMTMSAQLMAAGADQGSIIKHLEKPQAPKAATTQTVPASAPAPRPPVRDDHELKPDQEKDLPHAKPPQPKSPLPTSPIQSRPPVTNGKSTVSPPPKFAPAPPPPRPPKEIPTGPLPPPQPPNQVFQPAAPVASQSSTANPPSPLGRRPWAVPSAAAPTPPSPPAAPAPSVASPSTAPLPATPPAPRPNSGQRVQTPPPAAAPVEAIDVEAARRAVEEATKGHQPPSGP